ncbi:MAG: isoprenylcysteine carboxylmethyltransferase family protein, partial [Ktedonobacterales bacterium]
MRPLPLTSLLYGAIWLIAFLIWFVSETGGIVVEAITTLHRHLQHDATMPVSRDRGSAIVFAVAHGIGIWGAWVMALLLPAATIRWQRPLLFTIGIALMLVGVALRWYAIRALGRYFTRHVAITPGQEVVTTGPYRYVRHPS